MALVIYALFDRRDPAEARYVGQTRDLAVRMWHHRNPAPTAGGPVVRWARELGEQLGHLQLARVETEDQADDAEREWIAYYRARGADLLNVHDCARRGFRGAATSGTYGSGRVPPRGEAHRRAAFTDEQVREIRQRVAEGEDKRALAKEFGVTRPAIHSIAIRRTWKHVH